MSPSSKPERQPPSVEELITAFKRRGNFDRLRKSTLSSFQGSNAGEKLVKKLTAIAQAEVEKDSNLLYRDRSKSSILIGGAVDRAGVLDDVKRQRDAIFEAQAVNKEVLDSMTKLLEELGQTADASSEPKHS